MCLRPCPKEHITAPQVSIVKISCERLLLSKTCVIMRKNCLLITPVRELKQTDAAAVNRQIFIQIQSDGRQGPTEFTWP